MRIVLDPRKHARDLKLRIRKAVRPGSSHFTRTVRSGLFAKTPTVARRTSGLDTESLDRPSSATAVQVPGTRECRCTAAAESRQGALVWTSLPTSPNGPGPPI